MKMVFIIFNCVLMDIIFGQTPMARKEDYNPDAIPLNYNDFIKDEKYYNNNNNYLTISYWSIINFIGFLLIVFSVSINLYNCSILNKISHNKAQHKFMKISNQDSD